MNNVEHKPAPFILKEKIGDMTKYGKCAVAQFPRRERQTADNIRASVLKMYRLAIEIEKKYYKKTTLRQIARKPGRWYYLKLDIAKYFYRVDHDILIDILARRIKDADVMWLLESIINSEGTNFGLPAGASPDEIQPDQWVNDKGMPIGNLTSQLFANIYLNELDQYCKHALKLHYYIRYMDDVIILHNDKKQLRGIQDSIQNYLADELRLDLNDKTTIGPATGGITFVGYRIWPTHRKIRKQTARRIIRRVGQLSNSLARGDINYDILSRSAASYNGLLKHSNSHGLRRKLNEIYTEKAKEHKTWT